MDVEVIPSQLIEVPAPDGTGVDRRAFGEFIGPQGELASYAFGWTSGADPHIGRISIGIGAGNEGGGTFHAAVVEHGDSYGFALVDDPFAQVPQGGPDLNAEQARAHEDLPFIWWVVNHVMDRDPRAWWMRHWLLGTTCITTVEVFEGQEPVVLVSHDDDDSWQLIGATDASSEGKIGHLHHAIDNDSTLMEMLNLEPGFQGTRSNLGEPWARGHAAS